MAKDSHISEEFRKAIILLADSLDEIRRYGVNEKTIIVLLNHKTKVPMGNIRRILDGIETLEEDYFKYIVDDVKEELLS